MRPSRPPLRAQAFVAKYLAAEQRLGRLDTFDPLVIARAYMGALSVYVFSEMLAQGGRGPKIAPEAYVIEYVSTLLTGMARPRPVEVARSGSPPRSALSVD